MMILSSYKNQISLTLYLRTYLLRLPKQQKAIQTM